MARLIDDCGCFDNATILQAIRSGVRTIGELVRWLLPERDQTCGVVDTFPIQTIFPPREKHGSNRRKGGKKELIGELLRKWKRRVQKIHSSLFSVSLFHLLPSLTVGKEGSRRVQTHPRSGMINNPGPRRISPGPGRCWLID